MVKVLCFAISCPRSQVNERRRVAGSLSTCLLSAATTVVVSLLGTLMSMIETRVSFHQGCDVSVFTACEQIAFPVTRNSAVFNLRRSFPDGDGIDDLTMGFSASPRLP